ncbi:Clan MP, family M67, Poh1-like metallopeptidase [Trichomonas vaginalis G3]|uniref:Clan MP, family M67, Poh1-like metallopeptidase n=1 Tax=Trichomonas vaginalis (strain ATCC PRA-98 / G3) TaxID=412133 RepID=A2DP46_TRIV3|nr:proteasome-mediated ubiquitin-dependent protein catabolic process [Trichomonas vaginalis G3]EAY17746.1 Clan MP, family M67, Poh1-like metallopeptidase [Trichomonas vaginalis G3]KAI5484225.1 proteasome-mediated ubiquitin-dependent protein catabolic process [Trichomonas vaginalis G3]|eukprot:XP_001329881.1 Clan MP, family M67, Poh1-like metallopeptidase [Trichomonas vaginalis G3]
MLSETKRVDITKAAVHPIVLLSIADHHNRVVTQRQKRVIGILLGDIYKGQANIFQCFGVPFEEDSEDPSVWYFDTNFIEEMYSLHKKVTLKEKIIGWYSSLATVSPNDLEIHRKMCDYCPDPIFLTTDVGASDPHEIPACAFLGAERVRKDGQPIVTSFRNIPTTVEFLEVEEIGVEHLLRDIKDVDMSAIGCTLTNSIHGLAALEHRLRAISQYLGDVIDGKLQIDNEILGVIQSIFNLLPNFELKETVDSLNTKADDATFMIFISQLCRSVVSLHELVNGRHPPLAATDPTPPTPDQITDESIDYYNVF